MNQFLKTSNAILKYAIKHKCTLGKACNFYKKSESFIRDFKRRGLDRGVKNGSISTDEYHDFLNIFEEYKSLTSNILSNIATTKKTPSSNKKNVDNADVENTDFQYFDFKKLLPQEDNLYDSLSLTPQEKVDIEYNADTDENYDERSLGESIKDTDGNIIEYHYKILIRDQEALEGTFNREEMDKIYRLYSNLDGAGLTLRAVSREFHNLTFRDFKRILRAFNITKASVPVAPHILMEKSPDDIAQIIMRNKENIVLKKLDNERSKLIEKYLLDAQRTIVKFQKSEEWITNIVDKYYRKDNTIIAKEQINFIKKPENKTIKSSPTICIFGDIHYGKKYDNTIFGRGYNKDIAHERIMQIASETVQEHQRRNSTEIIFVCVGDVLESIAEDGMRSGHHYEMDLFQEDQIFFAVDSIKKAILFVLENTNCSIKFYAISGNHDRIKDSRDEDRSRTAGKIVYKILERELTTQSNKIQFFIPQNNLMRFISGKLMLFAQHGDSSLYKKKPSDLITLYGEPGCYSILISGHFHKLKVEEGTNFLSMTLPSVASADKFILEDLGSNNLPGFILGNECFGYGFDYKKITLY